MAAVSTSGSDPFSNIPIDDFSKSTQRDVHHPYPHNGQQHQQQQQYQYQLYGGNDYSHAQHQQQQQHRHHHHPGQQPQQQQQQHNQQVEYSVAASYGSQSNGGASGVGGSSAFVRAPSSPHGQMAVNQTQTQNPYALTQTQIQTHLTQVQAHTQAQTLPQTQRLSQDMAQMTLAQPQQYHNLVPEQQQQQQQQQHMVQHQHQQQQQQQMIQHQHQHQNVVPPQQLQYHTVQHQQQQHQHQVQQHQQHQHQGQQQSNDLPPTNNVVQQQHQEQRESQDLYDIDNTFSSNPNLQNLSTLTSSLTSDTKPTTFADQNYSWYVDDVSSIESLNDNRNKHPRRSNDNISDDNEDRDNNNSNRNDITTSKNRQTQFRQSHSSSRSYHTESSSFVTHYSISPLDKSTFAPPPTRPGSMEIMPRPRIPPLHGTHAVPTSISLVAGGNGPSPLPNFSRVTHSGQVSARLSPKSLILKKWRRVFWVTYGETTVLVFRSRADFDEWASNPYMSAGEREAIVKLRVEFRRSEDTNLGVKCYRASQLHSKDYGKSGTMCTFKLEQWMHHGPVVIGAFASSSKPEIGSFQIICNAMIERQKYGVKHLIADSRDEIADNILTTLCKQERT